MSDIPDWLEYILLFLAVLGWVYVHFGNDFFNWRIWLLVILLPFYFAAWVYFNATILPNVLEATLLMLGLFPNSGLSVTVEILFVSLGPLIGLMVGLYFLQRKQP